MSRGRRRRGRDLHGILLLDKPVGLSSNQALQRAKRLFDARKAGHTGNLDVQATGLLPVCFGEATKVSQFLLDADKRYTAAFRLGERTTTGDVEGEVVERRPVDAVDRRAFERAMAAFEGAIEQIPPMHSAIKRDGQPLYKLAHRGIEVERDSRTVHIHRFALTGWSPPLADVEVHCSKGTYIRTLAEDLGERLGCGAHVAGLRRTGAGPFDVADALTLESLQGLAEQGETALDGVLRPLDTALAALPRIALTEDAAYYVGQGQAVLVPRAPTSGLLRLYDARERFVGVGEVIEDGRVAPRRLFRAGARAEGERAG